MPVLISGHGAEIHANACTLYPGENEVSAEQLAELEQDPAVSLYLTCGLVVEQKAEPKPPAKPADGKGGKANAKNVDTKPGDDPAKPADGKG